MELLPFVQNVVSSAKTGLEGLASIYDVINARLSATRASQIDYLTNISQGYVAPQSFIGLATDAPSLAAVVPDVDVFKAIDKIYSMLEEHAGTITPSTPPPTPIGTGPCAPVVTNVGGSGIELAFLYNPYGAGGPGCPGSLKADFCVFIWQQGQGRFHHASITIGYTVGGNEVLSYILPDITEEAPLCGPQAGIPLLLQYEIPMNGKIIYTRLNSYTSSNLLLGYIDYAWITVPGDMPTHAPISTINPTPFNQTLLGFPPIIMPGPTQLIQWLPIENAVGYTLDVTAFGNTTRYGSTSSLATHYTITVPTGGGQGTLLTTTLTVYLKNRLPGSQGEIIAAIPAPIQYLTPA